MEDKKAKPIMEDKSIQKGPELTQSSGINIEPPKQESVQVQTSNKVSQALVRDGGSTNVIKPPETTQDINIKRSEKEEKPEFLKHPPKKLDKKEKSKFIGTVVILSLIISTCSIILLLFCIKDTAIPQFIQPAIDYLYKIAQNYL
ncbi:MAG: hypothetical protein Q7J67_02475 [bacterium]|nr:hypothetical protein [bacterium]